MGIIRRGMIRMRMVLGAWLMRPRPKPPGVPRRGRMDQPTPPRPAVPPSDSTVKQLRRAGLNTQRGDGRGTRSKGGTASRDRLGSLISGPYLTAPKYGSGFAMTLARHPWQQRNTLRPPRVTLIGVPIEPSDFLVTTQTR